MQNQQPSLAKILLNLTKSSSGSVEGRFEELLTQEINIPSGARSAASTSQKHLREFLNDEHDRDGSFPIILSVVDDDFIGGSFGRHTKIWPLDDIDIYFPLDGSDLFYMDRFGTVLPYKVLSDGMGIFNPLLQSRWLNGNSVSSRKLIAGFVEVIRRHYPASVVRPDGQAVNIRLTHGETEDEDGLGFDVVPCFYLRSTFNPNEVFYIIPDGSDGWIRTNPRIDANVVERLHINNNRIFRKAVKIVKYWSSIRLNSVIKSYYIELTMMRAFLNLNSNQKYVKAIAEGVAIGLNALNTALTIGNQTSWVIGAPEVKPGEIEIRHKMIVGNVAKRASTALALASNDQEEAIEAWGTILGSPFSETEVI